MAFDLRMRACGAILGATLAASALGAGCKRPPSGKATPAASASSSAARVAPPSASALREQRIAQGASLYRQYCALCHGPEARGYAADNAPSLVSKALLSSADDTFLARTIRNGRPGTPMGAYGKSLGGPLSDDDIHKLLAFLRGNGPLATRLPDRPVRGDASRGQPLFEENCQKCHGTRFDRGPSAPHISNPEFLDAASAAFLFQTIHDGREGTPMEAFHGKLSDAQIDDIVALLRSWAPPPRVPPPASPTGPAIPADLPVVLNPKGPQAQFTLRDGRFVAAEQVHKALKAKNRIVIIDARSPAEWHRLRITGAIPVPYHDFARLDAIPKDDTWVVAYCACPHHASGVVVDELRKRGYTHTAVLDEGIFFWEKQGYPIAGEAASARPPASASASASARPPGPPR